MDARDAIERLCSFENRAACTDAERRAAAWLHDRLRADGHEAWVEARWVRPQRPATVLLAALAAAAGSLVSVAVPVAGAVAAAAAAIVLAVEAFGRVSPLRMLLPRRATQHVLTVPDGGAGDAAPDTAAVPLVVAAPYDAPRRGVIFGDVWRRLARRVRSPLGVLAACAALVAVAASQRAAGVEEAWLGVLQLVPTAVLIAAVGAAIDVALSPASPGANDSASAVAVALALHAELTRDPPARLAPALLLHGAGSAAPEALRRHLRAERLDARGGVVLALRPCGAGTPAWASRHARLRALDVASGEPRPRPPQGGLPVLALGCLDRRGLAPRAHQADDLPEHVDDDAVAAALALALDLVDAIDAELARY